MTNNKSIAIIVPIYNCEKYIHPFLDCILAQTYSFFHLYLVYDKSTDGTIDILKTYEKQYNERITILYSKEKKGPGPARDIPIDKGLINEDYVIFLDSDDIFENNFLEEMINTAIIYNVDVVMCGLDCFDDNTGRIVSTQMIDNTEEVIYDVNKYYRLAYFNPAVWNKLYRRELIEKVRFGNIQNREDCVYIAKILPYIKSIKFLNKILCHYRMSDASFTERFTIEDFKTHWNYFKALSQTYLKDQQYADYLTLYELIVFTRCAVGMTYKVCFKDLRNTRKYCEYSYNMLNELVPCWRKNKELMIRSFYKKTLKENAISACALLYKLHIFPLFIYIYWLFKKITKKDVRW